MILSVVNMTLLKMTSNTVPCNDCGCPVPEGEIYGEWDDFCKECYYENDHAGKD